MWRMLWPVLLIVAANSFYNICAKSTPRGVDPFASLFVMYAVAGALSLILFFATGREKNFIQELSKTNWTSWAFGVAIMALEFAYINLYRAGWKVSIGSLVANISLACVLLFVGMLIYKETISLRQVAGIGVCALGLFLISK